MIIPVIYKVGEKLIKFQGTETPYVELIIIPDLPHSFYNYALNPKKCS